jgi:hypothetical protein
MTSDPPLAFLYDRQTSPTPGVLVLRLDLCRLRAGELGWEVAGEWVDSGDDALTGSRRPQFDAMLTAVREAAAAGRTVVCLVADWHRLSREAATEAGFRARITAAGGFTATAAGEDDQPGSGRGRVTMIGRSR